MASRVQARPAHTECLPERPALDSSTLRHASAARPGRAHCSSCWPSNEDSDTNIIIIIIITGSADPHHSFISSSSANTLRHISQATTTTIQLRMCR